jgi:hypothetical protein
MKRSSVFAGIILLLIVYPGVVWGQGRHQWAGRYSYVLPYVISVEKLDLSQEQRALVRKIRQDYDDQIKILQGKLMSKRLELQSVFRNPQADERLIRAKAREVFDLQNESQSLTMDFQIQIRGLLSAEQLRNWCTPGDSCFRWERRQ